MGVTNVVNQTAEAAARKMCAAMRGKAVIRGKDAVPMNSFSAATIFEEMPFANDRTELAVFEDRFLRCTSVLHLVACRILGANEDAACAIANCRTIASQNPSDFSSEGAFRSWVVRILIDEALAIARHKK
jgi:hypothetical protein